MKTLLMVVDIEEVDFERLSKELNKWFNGNDCGLHNLQIFLRKFEIESK